MALLSSRQERLHRLIDFARVYRGWSRHEIARALGRDSTKLYPATDNPKIDFVVALAELLDWSIDDVVQYLWDGEPLAAPSEDFEKLDAEARQAHGAGQYRRMAELAQRMFLVARTAEERARACNREHGAWDGLGRYTKALEAACRGLREGPLSAARRHQIQTNLANSHYTLWELTSALAHAHVVAEWYAQRAPQELIDRKNEAFALYVRGHARRRLVALAPAEMELHAIPARQDLTESARRYRALADELGDDRLRGIANTCDGGLLELAVELGDLRPAAAIERFMAALEQVIDPQSAPVGDWLESHGWWCVFGANVALRQLTGRALQHAMAIFTDKALEIAGRLDNWALRERAFSMQYQLHEAISKETGLELPFVVDDEDRRLITGAMGRFPSFRNVGWRILRAAKVIQGVERN